MSKSKPIQISVYEAKTNLSRFLNNVENGQRVFLGRFGKPEFEIIKASQSNELKPKKSAYGSLKAKIKFGNDFDKSDEEISKLFGY